MGTVPRGKFLVIGTDKNLRVSLFQSTLSSLGLPRADILPWKHLLENPERLFDHVGPDTVIRIESPGKDFEVERLILALGASVHDEQGFNDRPAVSAVEARNLELDRGRIYYPRQWFMGFRAAMLQLQNMYSQLPQNLMISHPQEIVTMFDKPECHAILQAADVPVPGALPRVSCYDDLVAEMETQGWNAVFVKMAHGSSASGIAAFRTQNNRHKVVTTVEVVRVNGTVQLYNTRKLRILTRMNLIKEVIDEVCRHHAHVEQWLPKATQRGKNLDLRILMVAGEPCHTVARVSQTPMTNLHLLNQRGDVDALKGRMGEEAWGNAMDTCRNAARLFPNSLHAGIDLLITPSLRDHAVLEVNAFGDLLPGVLHHGQDTYSAQIQAVQGGWSPADQSSTSCPVPQ